MNKKLFVLAVIVASATVALAQMKPAKRYAPAYEYDTYKGMEMVECGRSWASMPINVKGGGKAPGIVTLTRAFNSVWKVSVVDEVLTLAKNPKFTRQADPDYDTEIIVDRPNGYMCVDSGGTDGDYMESCVWRCDDGHRLFAIRIGDPTDPEIEYVCFYDYDPATETMTPVESPVDTFQPTHEFYNYSLPRKGKDFIINEYLLDEAESTLQHIYSFNGKRHVFSQNRTVSNNE